jgi:hypothetical protein
MTRQFVQFLGSKPGDSVELLDDSASPYLVRNQDGLEYTISADDFSNYYKPLGESTPQRWKHLLTDPDAGTVDATLMAEVMNIVHGFREHFRDFDKARSFVRDVLRLLEANPDAGIASMREQLEKEGWKSDDLSEDGRAALSTVKETVRDLLLSGTCAEIPFPNLGVVGDGYEGPSGTPAGTGEPKASPGKATKKKPKAAKQRRGSMKNVEMDVDGDSLTITVDLSKEFGPSKSGKTIIVASTEGNKTVRGKEEKIGLNIYRQETKKPSIGRKDEFKNVKMALNGSLLTITVDLTVEFGDSKSGKTTIIASTGGNQLVYGRGEKIGLNVYKSKE